ncbi:MAG: carbohydrate kinase [Erysipelothrix sp.]|nr:carbohydrate kinase [Erysipelothrix sp.]
MKDIYVIGEVLVDLIDVEHKGLVYATKFEKKFGGASANVAIAAARLGANVSFLGTIGTDYFGDYLKNTLLENNVNLNHTNYSGKTTIAWVGLDEEGERYFSFNRGSDGDYKIKDLKLINSIIHFGSATAFLGGNLKKSYFKLLDNATTNNNLVSFDPNFREDLVKDIDQFIKDSLYFIKRANFVKLSLEEVALITSKNIQNNQELEESLINLSKNSKATFFVTLGPKGTIVLENKNFYYIDTVKIKQVDSTGAGDAFVGALLSKIVKDDYELEKAVYFANKVGAIVCTKHGAIEALPYEDEVLSN